jgi:sugar lactone lactonase YvrE
VAFTVTVKSGSAPLSGATVQLYAAGTTGNGSAPTSLLTTSVATSTTGVAAIPAGYTCPSTNSLVYLVARGGAISSGSANANTVLMTAIGACSTITASSSFLVDEATTVAALYPLAPFYAAGGNIGATATNSTGLTNAFQTAYYLASPYAGNVPILVPVNVTYYPARVNSVANLLHTCVAAATACAKLYSTIGTSATNTLDALFTLVKNPATNTAALYTLAATDATYTPALTKAPADFTMFFTIAGGGMVNPTGLGIDSSGNVWVASYFSIASKFTSQGSPVFANGLTGSGLNSSYGLAVDASDNAWIPNEQPYTGSSTGSVSVLTSTGTSAAGTTGYLNGGIFYPHAVAIDPNGTTWVVDYGNSHLTLLNSSGTPLSGTTGFSAASIAFPVVVAVDGNHFGWVGDQNDYNVTKVAPDGSAFTAYNCCYGASGIAIDQSNNVWISNFYGNSVSMISAAGVIVSNQAYTANGTLSHPQGIAVDGAGNIWLSNYRAPYLTELAGASASVPGAALTPASGFGSDAGLVEAYALAIDASGNIWVSNYASSTITKFIGLATPVKTPLLGIPKLP